MEIIETKRRRMMGIDMIKAYATIMVFVSHFIAFSGARTSIYGFSFLGVGAFALEQLLRTSVPLFFLCTGYLYRNTRLSRTLKDIVSVYLVWLFYCLVYVCVDILWFGKGYSFGAVARQLLQIGSIISREWFIRSYLILILFAPLINIGWESLKKSHKQYLILVLFALTSLVKTIDLAFNISVYPLDLTTANYAVWPFLYLLIGKYIADYGVKLRKKHAICLFLLVLLGSAIYLAYRFRNSRNDGYESNTYRISVVILTVLFFAIFYDLSIEKKLAGVSKWVAGASLDAYLLAIVIERMLYEVPHSAKDFILRNCFNLLVVIFMVLLWGNIRIGLAKKVSLLWKESTRKTFVAYAVIAVLLISSLAGVIHACGRSYNFYARNANLEGQLRVNQGSITQNYIESKERASGNISFGPYVKLGEGLWTVSVDYEVDRDGFRIDAVTDTGQNVMGIYELNTDSNNISFQIEVTDPSQEWEFRTFSTTGDGHLKLYKISVTQEPQE